MSADNGYILRNNAAGQFVLQMYFTSDDVYPDVESAGKNQIFDTLEEAILEFNGEQGYFDKYWSEYGLTIDIKKPE